MNEIDNTKEADEEAMLLDALNGKHVYHNVVLHGMSYNTGSKFHKVLNNFLKSEGFDVNETLSILTSFYPDIEVNSDEVCICSMVFDKDAYAGDYLWHEDGHIYKSTIKTIKLPADLMESRQDNS